MVCKLFGVDNVGVQVFRCVRASSNSTSVRATVPEEIAREMGLSIGDVLDWEIEERKSRKVASPRTRAIT